ncbi:hypothetical protein J1N35_038677 [Gossypium stocksii]|uniref:Uncharacterized protein n=1 Tax=Gossypium stocksii TaxID=47602 RepID=A0A9D3UMB0_9ROSI|nr:hypothetical protein J1N35_038677 [Gossypium stocksii]
MIQTQAIGPNRSTYTHNRLLLGDSPGDKMFGSMILYFSTKPKPKMKPIELKTPPEQTQTITRVVFDILKEHGSLTVVDT